MFFKDTASWQGTGEYARLEWFWDTDPGFGKAQQILLPAGTTELRQYNFQVPVPSSFTDQKHYLYVRVGSDWSQTVVRELDFTGISLPVTLLHFQAKSELQKVRLDWAVAQELNMDRYVVERSTDGRKFDSIGVQQAVANLKQGWDYSLYDERPHTGVNYYRLRQVELDGTFKYSPVVTVLFSGAAAELNIFPNPATGYFQVRGADAITGVLLTDMEGKVIRRYEQGETYGLEGIAAGSYFVHVFMPAGAAIKPIIIK